MSDDRFIEPKHHEIKHEGSNSIFYSQIMHELAQTKSLTEAKQDSAQKPPSVEHLLGLHISGDKQADARKPEHQEHLNMSDLLKTLTMLQPHSNEPVQHHELFKPTPFTKALAEGAAAGAALWNVQQSFMDAHAKALK